MDNFDNYLFRSFEVYSLLTNPTTKAARESGELSVGTKTHLMNIYIDAKYHRRKHVSTKEMSKGLECEEDSITLFQESQLENQLFIKNKERKDNGFITGECDLYNGEMVIDVKTSWDVFTFAGSDLTKQYEAQLRSYMWLWGCTTAKLAYCLVDTPEHFITDELYRSSFGYAPDEFTDEIKAKIAGNMIVTRSHYDVMKLAHFPDAVEYQFVEIPPHERVKIFDVEHDPKFAELVTARVIAAREYLNKLSINRL